MSKFHSTLFFLAVTIMHPSVAFGAMTKDQETLCRAAGNKVDGDRCITDGGRELAGGTNSFLATIVNLLLYVAGAVAVIVIIFGGIRYITSTGDAARIKQAKDTILYGVIGLVIALLAYAIVNTVANQLGGV